MAHIDRLEMVYDLISNTDDGHFDLDEWVYSPTGWKGKTVTHKKIMASCGSVGCAVGLAFSTKAFRKLGASMVVIEGDTTVAGPEYDGYEDWEAVARFFDITNGEAYFLFDPDEYPVSPVTRSTLLRRLRAFIDDQIRMEGSR